MTVQIRIFRWTQAQGDVLTPTKDIVASPPFAELAANSEQTVRIVRMGLKVDQETAYRLIVDQLPPATNPAGSNVMLLMRHSIPLFAEDANASKPSIEWRVTVGGGDLQLSGSNSGGRHLRLANVKLIDSAGLIRAEQTGLVGYVLANSKMTFTIPLAQNASKSVPVRMTADTDQGRIDVALSTAPS